MDLYLLIVTIFLLALQLLGLRESDGAAQILTQYDGTSSSSSFGEPIFRLEPPNVINFANTQGTTILCLVSGSPRPTVNWYSSVDQSQSTTTSNQIISGDEMSLQQSRPVNNVTNLRLIMHNGALLRLLPFKESDFRQEIHSTEYRCVASNQLATIHSRSVLVQAVMSNGASANGNSANSSNNNKIEDQQKQQQMEVKVSDEFVGLNSVAVFKCRATSGPEFSHLTEWFTSDGIQIRASDTTKANKLVAFRSGELHVNNVDMLDLQRTYGCRLRNSITNKVSSSSGLAQLIVTDSLEPTARGNTDGRDQATNEQAGSFRFTPQVVHSISQLIMTDPMVQYQQNHYHMDQVQRHHHQQQQPPADQMEWRLLLPCAVRGPPPRELRWFFQPFNRTPDQKPVPLDQWAVARSIGLQILDYKMMTTGSLNVTARSRQQQQTNFIVGPTFLAIEWPTRAQGGRYTCQWVAADGAQAKTLCDINVIIRQPMKLRMEPVLGGQMGEHQTTVSGMDYYASAQSADRNAANFDPLSQQDSWLSRIAVSWFGWRAAAEPDVHEHMGRLRTRRHAGGEEIALQNPLLHADPRRVQVQGPGVIEAPPIVSVGQRLQLDCRGCGHPIEGVKWFRNGLAINTQSSNDFQIEITNPLMMMMEDRSQQFVGASGEEFTTNMSRGCPLLSSLVIRQVQAKEAGLNVFECFAYNSLGDRARGGLVMFVAERPLLDWARSVCPVSTGNDSIWSENENLDYADYPTAETMDEPIEGRGSNAMFKRHNPLRRALVLESEPIELRCPNQQQQPQQPSIRLQNNQLRLSQSTRIEWRRWVAPLAGSVSETTNKQTTSDTPTPASSRSLNQLFGGDSRFVINGSSLQIRSPSKRYDEAVYFCRPMMNPTQSGIAEATGSSSQEPMPGYSQQATAATAATTADLRRHQQLTGRLVHQSSLAPPSASAASTTSSSSQSCDSLLDSSLFQGEQQQASGSYLPMSSISIRIVGKPKIDPFEFSRNLEERMRAVVVCAVISGQSPVDITWFKDGEFLLADEQISIDQANGFSSTLTFHRIQPAHMGLYTCVAANAFASTNHTSKLLVNVAPYFLDPPQSTHAILGSNVLVNCRAGGQPSPQIRWRKLVQIGGSGSSAGGSISKQVAPASGGPVKLEPLFSGIFNEFDSQVAPMNLNGEVGNQILNSNGKYEFRIVTSNSHIQILENGSMIIKEVELGDASRYVCQAFNGINPSLSEVIELTVLSPAQFDVHYETVTVKRDSIIKFNCAPKGDQPMQIEWNKEGNHLGAPNVVGGESDTGNTSQHQQQPSKYNEIAHLYGSGERQRHTGLVIQQHRAIDQTASRPLTGEGVRMSELLISYADRSDTGAFVCVAKNAFGKDELTYRLIVQEPPDVPTGLQAQGVQANNLKLMWMAPFDGNLPLSHFVIEYRRLTPQISSKNLLHTTADDRHNEWTRLVVSTGQLSTDDNLQAMSKPIGSVQQQKLSGQYSLALHQLSAKSTYHLRVAAVNGLGQSAFSSPIAVVTAEEPPSSRPDDLRAQPVSSSSIRILWRGPASVDEQAPVKGYYVSHRKLSQTQQQQQPMQLQKSNLKDQPTPEVSNLAQSQQWLATGSISASNSSNYRTQDQDPELQQQQMKQYVSSTANGANFEYMLNSLDKNSKYEIRVQPYNSMGVGPASDTIGQTLKFDRPGQPNLKLVSSRRQSFELKWTIPNDQPLMGFSLFYKCEYDDWQEIQLGIIYHYVIENLRCGNKYQIYLSAFNVVGRSDPSDVLSVRTEGTVPIAPDKGQFVRSNITEVVLDMSGWQSGGCPISSFMIQFKRLHDSNWFILSEGATPFAMSDKITIPDLAPATWYKLLVTALNEAGSTNAEYLFGTLTTNGKPIAPNFPLEGTHQETGGWFSGGAGGGGEGRGVFSSLNQLLFASHSSAHNQEQGGQLLLPMSCILLLVVTMLASYLYYSRSNGGDRSPASEQRKLTVVSSRPTQLTADQVHMQGCRGSAANTLNREEKQLIQSDQLQYQLMNANSMPLDAGQQQITNNHLDGTQHQADQMLESLVNHATLQSLMSNTNPRGPAQARVHGMRLLSTGNIFSTLPTNSGNAMPGSNCTNSSLSTHSTNCNFDCGASSSQASSSGTSGCGPGAKAKLQLIDESSLISDPINEASEQQQQQQHHQQQQQFLYGQQQGCNISSPARQLYNPPQPGHVDLINQNVTNHHEANQMFEANLGNLFIGGDYQTDCSNRCYGPAGQRLVSTSSFASAADLMQRQQKIYQKQHANEPIYQRLDNFQAKQQHQQFIIDQAKSNTIHSNAHNSMDDFCLRSMTLDRTQPFHLESDSQYPSGLYLPPNDQSMPTGIGPNHDLP